ncbi:MAG: C69 family dipeptidase [Anaerolineae bacterium]
MCDTLTVTSTASADGIALFAKNSDREPNEAHEIVLLPAADHAPGDRMRCTYIEIDQAPHTCAVALAKPFWIWGAEMGVNQHGVTIGNEAVFTKEPYAKEGGLTGMDLLRLGLERGATARAALDVMVDLLAQHGQGGNCGFAHALYYHNSFLIADPHEAWVLETAGRHWATRQVQSTYAISNAITLGSQYDLASPDLVSNAVRRGWCKEAAGFDFGRCYSDFLYTRFSDSRARCALSTRTLDSQAGRATPLSLMAALRQHHPAAGARVDARGRPAGQHRLHARRPRPRARQPDHRLAGRAPASRPPHPLRHRHGRALHLHLQAALAGHASARSGGAGARGPVRPAEPLLAPRAAAPRRAGRLPGAQSPSWRPNAMRWSRSSSPARWRWPIDRPPSAPRSWPTAGPRPLRPRRAGWPRSKPPHRAVAMGCSIGGSGPASTARQG